MALIGYARVSTVDQSLDLQIDALNKAGCERIFQEKVSGRAKVKRPEFEKCLEFLRQGDVLVVWKLDRLGRNVKQLMSFAEELNEKGIGLKILTMDIDTTTPTGRLLFTILAGLAEMEHDLLLERTKAGLDAARARGRVGGRKPIPQEVLNKAFMLWDSNMLVKDICSMLPLEKSSFHYYNNKRLQKKKEQDEQVTEMQSELND